MQLRAPTINSVENVNAGSSFLLDLFRSADDTDTLSLELNSQTGKEQSLTGTANVSMEHTSQDFVRLRVNTIEVPYAKNLDEIYEFNESIEENGRMNCTWTPKLAKPLYLVEPTIKDSIVGTNKQIISPLNFSENSGRSFIGTKLRESDTIDAAYIQENLDFTANNDDLTLSQNFILTDSSKLMWNQLDFDANDFQAFVVDIKTISQEYPYSISFAGPVFIGLIFPSDNEITLIFKDRRVKYSYHHFNKQLRLAASYDTQFAQLYVNGQKLQVHSQEFIYNPDMIINRLGADVKSGITLTDKIVDIPVSRNGNTIPTLSFENLPSALATYKVKLNQSYDPSTNTYPKLVSKVAQGFIPTGHRQSVGLNIAEGRIYCYKTKIANILDTIVDTDEFENNKINTIPVDIRNIEDATLISDLKDIAFSDILFSSNSNATNERVAVNNVKVPNDVSLPNIPIYIGGNVSLNKISARVEFKPSFIGQADNNVYGASTKSIYNLFTLSQDDLPESLRESTALVSKTRSVSVLMILDNSNDLLATPTAWASSISPFLSGSRVNFVHDAKATKGYRNTANTAHPVLVSVTNPDTDEVTEEEQTRDNVITDLEFKFNSSMDFVVPNQARFEGSLPNGKRYIANVMSFSCFNEVRDNNNLWESEIGTGMNMKGSVVVFQTFDEADDLSDAINVRFLNSTGELTDTAGKTLATSLQSHTIGRNLTNEATLESLELSHNENSIDKPTLFTTGVYRALSNLYDISLLQPTTIDDSVSYNFVSKFREVSYRATEATDKMLIRTPFNAQRPRPTGHINPSYNENYYAFTREEVIALLKDASPLLSDSDLDGINQHLTSLSDSNHTPYDIFRGADIKRMLLGLGINDYEATQRLTNAWGEMTPAENNEGVYSQTYPFTVAKIHFSTRNLSLFAIANTEVLFDPIFYVYPTTEQTQVQLVTKVAEDAPISNYVELAEGVQAAEVGQLLIFKEPLTESDVEYDLEYGKVWRDYDGFTPYMSRLVPNLRALDTISARDGVSLEESEYVRLDKTMPMGSWQYLNLLPQNFVAPGMTIVDIEVPEQDEEFNKYITLYTGYNEDLRCKMISFRTKEGVIAPAQWESETLLDNSTARSSGTGDTNDMSEKISFTPPIVTLRLNCLSSDGRIAKFSYDITLAKPQILGLIWQMHHRDTLTADVSDSVNLDPSTGDQTHYIRWTNKTPEELDNEGLLNPQYYYRWGASARVTPSEFVLKSKPHEVIKVPMIAWSGFKSKSFTLDAEVNGETKSIELPAPFAPANSGSVRASTNGACVDAMWGNFMSYPQVILGHHGSFNIPAAFGMIGSQGGIIQVEFYLNQTANHTTRQSIVHTMYLTNQSNAYSCMQLDVLSVTDDEATIALSVGNTIVHIVHPTKVPTGQWVKAFIMRDRQTTNLTADGEVQFKLGLQISENSAIVWSTPASTTNTYISREPFGYGVLAIGQVAGFPHIGSGRVDCPAFDGLVNLSNTRVWAKNTPVVENAPTDLDTLAEYAIADIQAITDKTYTKYTGTLYSPTYDHRFPALFKSEWHKGVDYQYDGYSFMTHALDMWDNFNDDNIQNSVEGGYDYNLRAYHDPMSNQMTALGVEGYQRAATSIILDPSADEGYQWQLGKSKLSQWLDSSRGLPTCQEYGRTILMKNLKSAQFTDSGRKSEAEAFTSIYSADSNNYILQVGNDTSKLPKLITQKSKEWSTRRDFNMDAFTFVPRHHTAVFDVVVRQHALNKSFRYRCEFMSMGEFEVNPTQIFKSLFDKSLDVTEETQATRESTSIESVQTFDFDASKIYNKQTFIGNAIVVDKTRVKSVIPRAFRVWFEGNKSREDQDIAGFLLSATGVQLKDVASIDGGSNYDTAYSIAVDIRDDVSTYEANANYRNVGLSTRAEYENFRKMNRTVEVAVTLGAPINYNAGRHFAYTCGWREDNRRDWFKSAIDARFNTRTYARNTTLRYTFLKSSALAQADDLMMRISYMGQHNLVGGNAAWGRANYNGFNYAPGNDMTGAIARTFERPMIARNNYGAYPSNVMQVYGQNFGASSAEYSMHYAIENHNLKNFSSRHGSNPRVDYRYFNPTKDNASFSQGYGALNSRRFAIASGDGQTLQSMGRHLAMYKGREWYASQGGSLTSGEFVVNARFDAPSQLDDTYFSWSMGPVQARYLPYGYKDFMIENGGKDAPVMFTIDAFRNLTPTAPWTAPSKALKAGTNYPTLVNNSAGQGARMGIFATLGGKGGSNSTLASSRSADGQRKNLAGILPNEIIGSEGGCASRRVYYGQDVAPITAFDVNGIGYSPFNINHICIPVQKSPHLGDLVIDLDLNADWKATQQRISDEIVRYHYNNGNTLPVNG